MAEHIAMRSTPAGGAKTFTGRSIVVSGLLILAGCGSTAGEEGQVAPTATTVATTTTTTIPPTTTTTIDFNRPVDQGTDPLAEDATLDDVVALVEDMRGQTDDAQQQIARLGPFPDLDSPMGSQIIDINVSIELDDGDVVSNSAATLRTPGSEADPVSFFGAELEARGWNQADRLSAEGPDGETLTTVVFRIPGTSGEVEELTIDLDVRPGVSFIELGYRTVGSDDEAFERLRAWQDALRVPNSADEIEARAQSADDTLTMTVVYTLQAETAAEARGDVLALVQDDEFETTAEASDDDASPVTMVGVENGETLTLEFEETGDDETVTMAVQAAVALTPFE